MWISRTLKLSPHMSTAIGSRLFLAFFVCGPLLRQASHRRGSFPILILPNDNLRIARSKSQVLNRTKSGWKLLRSRRRKAVQDCSYTVPYTRTCTCSFLATAITNGHTLRTSGILLSGSSGDISTDTTCLESHTFCSIAPRYVLSSAHSPS